MSSFRPPRPLVAALALPLVGVALACSGVVPATSGNRVACERYVAHMNGLEPCLGLRYEASNLCQEVDAAPVDMAPFYDCLVAHSRCEGADPKLELDRCEPPVLDLVALTEPATP